MVTGGGYVSSSVGHPMLCYQKHLQHFQHFITHFLKAWKRLIGTLPTVQCTVLNIINLIELPPFK